MKIYTLNAKGRSALAEELDRVGNTSLRDWLVNSRETCLNAWAEDIELRWAERVGDSAHIEVPDHMTASRNPYVLSFGADWFDVEEVSSDE